MKKILITGGFGFIGINLIQHLLKKNDYFITVLTRKLPAFQLPFDLKSKKLKLFYGDILDEAVVKNIVKDKTIVIHLAAATNLATTQNKELSMMKTNILGSTNLLLGVHRSKVEKVVFLSSSGVYADALTKKPFDESHFLKPFNLYSTSKLTSEIIANTFTTIYKMPIVTLRPFNVFGPYQSIDKPVPRLITSLLTSKSICLNHNGKQVRDWIYVKDVVSAINNVIIASTNKTYGESFNISTNRGVTLRQLTHKLHSQIKKTSSVIKLNPSGPEEPTFNVGNNSKAKKILNWSPQYSLEQGIDETINWYMYNTSWWKSKS